MINVQLIKLNKYMVFIGCKHCWRKPHWHQHVNAGQQGAGTNVPEQDPAGTLVPARHPSRH